MFESKAGVLLIGGLGFFALAFVANGVVPMLMYRDMPEQTVAEVVNANFLYQVEDLNRRFPESFKRHVGDATGEKWGDDQFRAAGEKLLRRGRDIYVGEGCWHCHSQFVRPVSNESLRYGPVAQTEEYQNELQRPVLFGTRRVGPDLSREGGRRSSDWHAVHFLNPPLLSPHSPMPRYTWFFDSPTSAAWPLWLTYSGSARGSRVIHITKITSRSIPCRRRQAPPRLVRCKSASSKFGVIHVCDQQ
jgi:hypothetical protein